VQVARFLAHNNFWVRVLLSLFHFLGIKLMVDGIYRRLKSRGFFFVQRREPLGHVHGNHANLYFSLIRGTWLYPTCLFSETLILYIYFQGCVEGCISVGVRSAVPPSRHRGWQAASLPFGRRLFRCCASLRPPSESWHRTESNWVSFVTSYSYRSSKLSPSLPNAIRFEVVALPCRAGIFVETSDE